MSGSPASKRARGEPAAAHQGGLDDQEEPSEGVAMAVSSSGGRVGLAWVEGQTVRPALGSACLPCLRDCLAALQKQSQ